MKEAAAQKILWAHVSKLGARLFRNNVGAFEDKTGRWVHYGVFGKGGHDLIGWTPVKILPEHVGQTLPVFTTLEVKGETGRPSKEQLRVMRMVRKAGGLSGIVYNEEEAEAIIKGVELK